MKLALRSFRGMTVTYARGDLLIVALLAAVVAVWAAVAGGSFSFRALAACEAAFFTFYFVGSLFSSWKALSAGILFDLPLRLLFGYAVVNTALLLLAWVSPFGIIANFTLVVAVATALSFAAHEHKTLERSSAVVWAVAIVVIATTLWCQDSIRPTQDEGHAVLFKPWVDGFYHAVHIRIFGASHGPATIEDFRMAEVPARLYHYGVYLTPAFIKQASGIHSYTAFAGILAPVGVLFTALAAYSFFGSLWGPWPGVAAAAALLVLPDGSQQGMQNPFMSYHWLTQISPSATYGLALMVVAWLFVIKGTTEGNRVQLLAGWVMSGVVVMYKLHYVIASALLLVLVPPLFFRGQLGVRRRALWTFLAVAVYALCLKLGQKVPGVPPLHFDGSCAGEILRLVQAFALPGPLKDFVVAHMGSRFSLGHNLLFGVPYVLATAFGLLVPLLVTLVIVLRRRMPWLYLLFPVVLLVNFLAMFFGLALDFTRSTPDELSQRPVMMVYFFVVAWVGGALGLLLVDSPRFDRFSKGVIVGLAGLLMAVPITFAPGVQRMWAMTSTSPIRVPKSLLQVTEYIRSHGSTKDIFQDSQFDRIYVIGALAERRTFVSHTMTSMPFRGDAVAARTAAVDRLMGLRDEKLVVGTARAYGIRWFILQRGNRVNWPASLQKPVLEHSPFTVFQF